MKIWRESIALTGNEVDDVVEYPLSDELDTHLAAVMSHEIGQNQGDIKKWLALAAQEWKEGMRDFAADDDPIRENKNFKAFIKRGKQLNAREASLVLRYIDCDVAETRAVDHAYRVQRDFAEEVAMVSLLHAAHHTQEADFVPVILLPVYREVQPMETKEQARQVWIKASAWKSGFHPVITQAYWQELKRKEHEEDAGMALANAYDLAGAYGFSLADSMKDYLDK